MISPHWSVLDFGYIRITLLKVVNRLKNSKID